MNIGNLIKTKRKELNLTLEELGNLVGVGKSTVRKWENGMIENMGRDKIALLSNALNISPLVLLDLDENMYQSANIDCTRVPLYEDICCGNGGFVDENIIDMIPVPSKGLNPRSEYFAQKAKGESMKDAGISNGDLLIFERTDRIENGVIGCFCDEDNNAVCKKYTEVNGIIMLQPMNSEFEPRVIDPLRDNFRCLGKLKKVIKDFNWED